MGKKVFFNPAVEFGFIFCEYCSDKPFLGIDLGVGIRPNDKITIFGEYDLVYSFEDFGDGHLLYGQWWHCFSDFRQALMLPYVNANLSSLLKTPLGSG